MITYIIDAILFFAPAGVANAAPLFANKIPILNQWKTPIDFGKSWRGKRIFGDNKTWRGLFFGTLAGGLTAYVLALTIYDVDPASTELVALSVGLGMLLGFGALVGDAVESFFKRRANVKPGKSWFPFDQTDYIVGGLIVSFPFVDVSVLDYFWVFVVWFVLHLVFSYVGYLLHLKDQPI